MCRSSASRGTGAARCACSSVGNVLLRQGKLEEALTAYRDSLAIAERLVSADRSNTQWQRDLFKSYEKVGDVQIRQGKLEEAVKAFRDSLAVTQRLVAADPSDTDWQRDLSISYNKTGMSWCGKANLKRRSRPTATAYKSGSA